MTILLVVVGWLLAGLGVTRVRYQPRRPVPRYLGNIVIPARINGRTLPDAEVVELFLRVDLRCAGVSPLTEESHA